VNDTTAVTSAVDVRAVGGGWILDRAGLQSAYPKLASQTYGTLFQDLFGCRSPFGAFRTLDGRRPAVRPIITVGEASLFFLWRINPGFRVARQIPLPSR